ncbi:hypothetical protein M9H77_26619 [Catharanthus roseus]|uniref:Uncharacterized protein n=1 Tax=Catharanthus roseus TaxID=4058 RepID=A0ACC0AE83_CATRO|nr:hypothetical protein M9H77_26619 [Catharanthus roseus]
MPISTPSSSSSVVGTLSRPAPLSSARPSCHLCKVLLPLAFLSYQPLTGFRSISEILKEHFVEAHASFGKILDRIKNMWYTEFGKRYRWDLLHERAIKLQGLDVRGTSGWVAVRIDDYCTVYESL